MESLKDLLQHLAAFNEGLRTSLTWGQRVQMMLSVCLLSSTYLHLLVRRIRPWYAGVAAVVPLVVVNSWLPLLFDVRSELVSRVVMALLAAWLANFKVRWCAQLVAPVWSQHC
jgi:hypothetical protein